MMLFLLTTSMLVFQQTNKLLYLLAVTFVIN